MPLWRVVGSMDRCIDAGFVERSPRRKALHPRPHSRKQERGSTSVASTSSKNTPVSATTIHSSIIWREGTAAEGNQSFNRSSGSYCATIYWRPTSSRIFHPCQRQFPTKRAIEGTQKTSVGFNFHGGTSSVTILVGSSDALWCEGFSLC